MYTVTLGHHHYSEHRSRSSALKAAKAAVKKALREGVVYPQASVRPPLNSSEEPITIGSGKQNPAHAIRAQVRRLPSGEVQIKAPLKRGENPMAKARELAKALGRKIVSVARVGTKRKR